MPCPLGALCTGCRAFELAAALAWPGPWRLHTAEGPRQTCTRAWHRLHAGRPAMLGTSPPLRLHACRLLPSAHRALLRPCCRAELVQRVAPNSFDAIVAIGGDGTTHEVLQARRPARRGGTRGKTAVGLLYRGDCWTSCMRGSGAAAHPPQQRSRPAPKDRCKR